MENVLSGVEVELKEDVELARKKSVKGTSQKYKIATLKNVQVRAGDIKGR